VGTINTQDYGGSQCGQTGTGSVLDHTGKYLYVSLFLPANDEGDGGCGVWQTYQVESNGHFKYLGYVEDYGSVQGVAEPDGIPTVSSALTRHFCYRAGVVASLKMLPKVKVPRRSENEETDQADYASRSDGCNQPTLSSGGSQRKKVDSG
jgi:hypothetical protein